MSQRIEKRLVTSSGIAIEASDKGGMTLSLRGQKARLAAQRLVELGPKANMKSLGAFVDEMSAGVAEAKLGSLTPVEKRALSNGLMVAAQRAEKSEDWSVLEKILAFCALGIPFLIDALTTNEAERVLAEVDRLDRKLELNVGRANQGVLSQPAPDISPFMNLVLSTSFRDSAMFMEKNFGEAFKPAAHHIASTGFSLTSPLNTGDFEASTGTRLVDSNTGQIVSFLNEKYVTMKLGERDVFSTLNGDYYFVQPGRDGRREPLTPSEIASLSVTEIRENRIEARFATADDIPARSGMPYAWRGSWAGSLHDVSWWGQCHASAMLGAMSMSAAKHSVTLFDEQSGKSTAVPSDVISRMVVYLGDGAFRTMRTAEQVGEVNRNANDFDDDSPQYFHEFVSRQIAMNLPFTLESHSLHEIWNYPVSEAHITEVPGSEEREGLRTKTRYIMRVKTTDGFDHVYEYSLTRNLRGAIIGGDWLIERNIARNGRAKAIPDAMLAYVGTEAKQRWDLDAGSIGVKMNGLSASAATLVADLYFASQQDTQGTDTEVYAVRRKDGTLEQLTKAEFDRLAAR